MKPVTLPNDFERMVPEYHRGTITYGEHISRYYTALELVKDKVVLDIACGSGYGTKILSESARQVIGVDISADAVAYAQANFSNGSKTDYRVGDGVEIPVETGTIDVLVTFETIEHIEDYRQFLKEAKRVLRPGGIMLLSTPNDLEFAEGNHFHVHEFKLSELQSLLKENFAHAETYFQGTWVYAAIYSAEDMKTEWDREIRTINAMPLSRDQSLYFFLICSDERITQDIPPIGVISEHWSARSLQEKQLLTDQHIHNLHGKIVAAEGESARLRTERDEVRVEYADLQQTRTYRLAQKLQSLYRAITFRR